MTGRLTLEVETAGPFKRALNAITDLVGEQLILSREGDEIELKQVDSGNVIYAEAHLPVSDFDTLEIEEDRRSGSDLTGIGIPEKVGEWIANIRIRDSLRLEMDGEEWRVESSNFDDDEPKTWSAPSLDEVRDPSDYPDLDLPAEAEVNAKYLRTAARMIKKEGGDFVSLGVEDDTFYLHSPADVSGVLAEPPAAVSSAAGRVRSLFASNYFYDFAYGIPAPKSTDVTLEIGDEFPFQFRYPIYGSDDGYVLGGVAPRIQSGDNRSDMWPSDWTPAAEPVVQASAESHEFARLFDAMQWGSVREAKIDWTDDGLRAEFVDPANVEMTLVEAGRSYFDEYEVGQQLTMGADTSGLYTVTDLYPKGTPVTVAYDPATRTYRISSDWLHYSSGSIDPDSIRQRPTFPDELEFTGRIETTTDAWVDAIDELHDGSAALLGSAAGTGFVGYEPADDDDADPIIETFDGSGASISLFSGDYLNHITGQKYLPETDLDIWLGKELPGVWRFEDGGLEVTSTIAPRVVNEDETHLEKSGLTEALHDAGVDTGTLTNIDREGIEADTIATLGEIVETPGEIDLPKDETEAAEDGESYDDDLGPYGLADKKDEGWEVDDVKALAHSEISDDTAKFLAYNFRSPGDVLNHAQNLENMGEDLTEIPGVGEARASEMRSVLAGWEEEFSPQLREWTGRPDRYKDDESDESADEPADDDVVVPKQIGTFERHDTPPGRLKWVATTGPHVSITARYHDGTDDWQVTLNREDGSAESITSADSKQEAVDAAVEFMQTWAQSSTGLEDDPLEAEDVTELARMFDIDVTASTWTTPLTDLPRIGDVTADRLNEIGIESAEGLAYWWLSYGPHLLLDVRGLTVGKIHNATKDVSVPAAALGLEKRAHVEILRAIRVFGIDHQYAEPTSALPDKQAILMAEEGGNQFLPPEAYDWGEIENAPGLPKKGHVAFGPRVSAQLHDRGGEWDQAEWVVEADNNGYELWVYIHPSGSYTVVDADYLDDVSTWFGGNAPDEIPAEVNSKSGEAVIFMPGSERNVAVGPNATAHKNSETVPEYVRDAWPDDAPEPVPEAEYTSDSYEEFVERMEGDTEPIEGDGIAPSDLEIPESPGGYDLAEIETDDDGVYRVEWTGTGGKPPAHLERPADVSVQARSHMGGSRHKWSVDVRHMDDDHQPPLSENETRRLQTYKAHRRPPVENAQDAIDRAVEWMEANPAQEADEIDDELAEHRAWEGAKALRSFLRNEYGLGYVKIGAFKRLTERFGPDVRDVAGAIRDGADPTEVDGIGSVTADHLETWANDEKGVAYVWGDSGQADRPVDIHDPPLSESDTLSFTPHEDDLATEEPWEVGDPTYWKDDHDLEQRGTTGVTASAHEADAQLTEADDGSEDDPEDSGTTEDAETASTASESDTDSTQSDTMADYSESDLNRLVNAGVHKGRARKILREYGTIDKAQNAGVQNMTDIHGIGETTAQRVMQVDGGSSSTNTDYESRSLESLREQVASGSWASDPSAVDRQATDAEKSEVPGPVAGQLRDLLRGYKGQVRNAKKNLNHAQRYATARANAVAYALLINEIRQEFGQPPMSFDELEANELPPIGEQITTETPGAPTNDSLGTSIPVYLREGGPSASSGGSADQAVASGGGMGGSMPWHVVGMRPDNDDGRPDHWNGEYGITADGQPYDPNTGRRLPNADWVFEEGERIAPNGGVPNGGESGDTYDPVADNAEAEASGGYTEQDRTAAYQEHYGSSSGSINRRGARYGSSRSTAYRSPPEGVDEQAWEDAYAQSDEYGAPTSVETEGVIDEDVGLAPGEVETEGVIDENVGVSDADDDQTDLDDYGIGETGADRADAYADHYSRENQMEQATEGFVDALERNLTGGSDDQRPAGRSLSHPDRPDDMDDFLGF